VRHQEASNQFIFFQHFGVAFGGKKSGENYWRNANDQTTIN